jgi:hypothetical protein
MTGNSNHPPIQAYALDLHQNSVDHGFWPDAVEGEPGFPTRNFGEMIALMHSELSEALEEHRADRPAFYHDPDTGKPEGIAIELIDAAIRVFDALGSMVDTAQGGIEGADQDGNPIVLPIDNLFNLKAVFNSGRPPKHGKAY